MNKIGFSQLDPEYSDMDEEVPIEIFKNWIVNELELEIPKSCTDTTDFTKFVENYILNQQSDNSDNSDQVFLTKNLLDSLQDIIITKEVPIKKALFTAVSASYSLIRARQSVFEPVFNRYAAPLTVGSVNLEGCFYQAILFLAKSNLYHTYM